MSTNAHRRRRNKQARRDRRRQHDTDFNWSDLRPVQPPPGLTCPDCAAVVDPATRELRHEGTCPFSAAFEQAIDADREYFHAHPRATQWRRPPTMVEVLNMFFATGESLPEPPAGHRWEPAGTVTVHAVADGVHARDLREVALIAVPAHTHMKGN